MNPKLTILTPTYNRAKLLPKCYQSLCNQTSKDFEWLIIDDGSTDNTEEVVNNTIRCNKNFPIIYKRKENGGKHTALNYSHNYINGEYLIILDDDDILTNDAVETILINWSKYKDNNKIWCLSLLKADMSAQNAILKYPIKAETQSNHIDFRMNQSIEGDCAEIVKSELFKSYRFPEYKNEKFIGEDCLWVIMAKEYDTVYINKVIYLCKYLDSGLSKSGRKMRLSNPQGMMYRSNLYLEMKGISLKYRIKHAILFDVFYLANKKISNYKWKPICFVFFPIGFILFKKWSK